MIDKQLRAAAARFAKYWKGKGYEKGEGQNLSLPLLCSVFGVAETEKDACSAMSIWQNTIFMYSQNRNTHRLYATGG